VIYYNAVVPARGAAMVDENAEYAALTRAAIAASPDGTIGLVREQVPMLMPEADEQTRDLFFELLVPQPGGYFLDPARRRRRHYPGRAGRIHPQRGRPGPGPAGRRVSLPYRSDPRAGIGRS
jgi:hypothetical protein